MKPVAASETAKATVYYREHRSDPEFMRRRRAYNRLWRQQRADRDPKMVLLERAKEVGCALCGERSPESLGVYPFGSARALSARQQMVKALSLDELRAVVAASVCLCATDFAKWRAGRVGLPHWVPQEHRWW